MAARKPLFLGSEGFSEEMAITDDITLGALTIGSGGDITLSGGGEVLGLPATPAATGAASKEYVDAVAQGLDVKDSVRLATDAALPAVTAAGSGVGKTLTATAVGVLTVDGVATVLNDRLLVKNQVAGVDNGIYDVTTEGTAGVAFILTRATDADTDTEVTAGMFCFAEEGTAGADSGFVLTTNEPFTLDTDALAFSQFSGAGQITAGLALVKTGNTLDVNVEASNPSLQIASDEIGIKFDASGGLQKLAAGTGVKLNGTTLLLGASGLSVKGLPSLFEINAVAVGAAVTAANVDTLTDGSNADALHIHSAAAATEVPKIEDTLTTATDTTAVADPVYVNGNDTIGLARADTDVKSRVIGIIRANAGAPGATPEVVSFGPAAAVLTAATANTPYYLQGTGGIGTALPGAANRVIAMGYAINATDLYVRITDYGKKAA